MSRIPWRTLLLLLVGSRLLLFGVAGLSIAIVEPGPHFRAPANPSEWFIHWDAAWYLDLARDGYSFRRDGEPTNVVFLPLYPTLVRIASLGGWLPLPLAGYLVSFAGLGLACGWLWRLIAREWGDGQLATSAVALLLFGPVSFFFSTLYSEAVFLPLVIGCLGFAREQRWWLAGSLGALAAATRLVGVLLIVPLLWEYLCAHRRGDRLLPDLRVPSLAACLLPLAGFGGYALLMQLHFGDPLIYFRGQLHWGRELAWWWDLFARDSYAGQPLFYQVWFLGTVLVAFALMLAGVWLRLPSTYLVFSLTFAFVYISSRFVEALPRYFSVIFPLYIVSALIVKRWPVTAVPLVAGSAMLGALSVILFVNGYWFT